MTIEYVRCPFCAFSKVLRSEKYDGGEFKWGELTIAPSDFTLLEIREASAGPGRGHKIKGFGGLQTVQELTIIEMLNDPQYRELAEQIRQRLIAILRDYLASGILDAEELL